MRWLVRNISWLIMGLVIIIYILYGVFVMKFNQDIVISDLLIIIALHTSLAVILNITMTNQADLDGQELDEVKTVLNSFNKAYDDNIVTRLEKVDPFIDYKNEDALMKVRSRVLSKCFLKYSDYFDVNGNYIGEYITIPKKDNINKTYYSKKVKDIRDKNKSIRKAKSLSITTLSRSDITTTLDMDRSMDPLKRVKSKESHKKNSNVTSIISKILFIIITSMIVIDGINGSDIITRIMLMLAIVAGSFTQYLTIYFYMKLIYPKRIQETIDYIEEFKRLDQSGYLDKYIKAKRELNVNDNVKDNTNVDPRANNEARMDVMIVKDK